jgi:hypothetical protein
LGHSDNPFRESGLHQRGHGGIGLLTLYLSPSVAKHLGDHLCLIGIETGFYERGSDRIEILLQDTNLRLGPTSAVELKSFLLAPQLLMTASSKFA